MKKTSFLVVSFLVFQISNGLPAQAAIIITSVETTGYASALSGIGYQDWNEQASVAEMENVEAVFGNYNAAASAYSNTEPTGTHTASSSASLSYDELSTTFQISGGASAYSPTQINSTSSTTLTVIELTLDSSYSYSMSGFESGYNFVQLTRLPPILPLEIHFLGDSGTIDPGHFRLQGFVSAYAIGEGTSSSDSYSATLAFSLVPSDADFDADGDVDGLDFLTWQRGYGTGTLHSEGNANGDGTIDASDLVIWQNRYNTEVASLSFASGSAVPEPSSVLLATFVGVLLCLLRNANH